MVEYLLTLKTNLGLNMTELSNIEYLPIREYESKSLQKINDFYEMNNFDVESTAWEAFPNVNSINGKDSFSSDLALILCGLDMEKYIALFQEENITLQIFNSLTKDDLIQLGVDETGCQKIVSYNKYAKKISIPLQDDGDDLVIVKNLILQCYALEESTNNLLRRMRQNPPKDYFVANRTKASSVLQLVANKTVQQTKRLTNALFSKEGDQGFINQLYKQNGEEVPLSIRKQLTRGSRLRIKRLFLLALSGIGMCSLAILIGSASGT